MSLDASWSRMQQGVKCRPRSVAVVWWRMERGGRGGWGGRSGEKLGEEHVRVRESFASPVYPRLPRSTFTVLGYNSYLTRMSKQ